MIVTDKPEALARTHRALARVYVTIGRLFLEIPSEELLASVESELACVRDAVRADRPHPSRHDTWSDVAEEIDRLREAMIDPILDIKSDWANLFAGVRKLPAPPWESCYLSGFRQVCSEITDSVRLAYLDACLSLEGSDAQPDDHVGLELQFVGVISDKIADALESGDVATAEEASAQRSRFIAEHLARWATDFSRDLEKAAGTEFYRSLARLTGRLVRCDVEQQHGDRVCDLWSGVLPPP